MNAEYVRIQLEDENHEVVFDVSLPFESGEAAYSLERAAKIVAQVLAGKAAREDADGA